ncbi:hypothetical protein ALC53_08166, partial [Atta colombica]
LLLLRDAETGVLGLTAICKSLALGCTVSRYRRRYRRESSDIFQKSTFEAGKNFEVARKIPKILAR